VGWDDEPLREATDSEAIQTIVVGAKKSGIAELLALLPEPTVGARVCASCHGERFVSIDPSQPEALRFVCTDCNGLGWIP
jgi:hypothetical protein